jgi:hypothetical protein
MEFGGSLAHDAMAALGRPGLRALLEKASDSTVYPYKEEFLRHAVLKIKDPTLAPDLYACCRDPKYLFRVRHAALWAISEMAGNRKDLTQMVISLAEDEKSDLRDAAVFRLGVINSPQAREVLYKIEAEVKASVALEKNTPQDSSSVEQRRLLIYAIHSAFFHCDTNRPPAILDSILAPTTLAKEKLELWRVIEESSEYTLLLPVQEQLRKCLLVADVDGRPINELRVKVWNKLHAMTGEHNAIELDYEGIDQLRKIAGPIIRSYEHEMVRKLKDQTQADKMAFDEALKVIQKWQVPKEGVKP